MIHKLANLNGIMIFMASMNGETYRAYESFIFAISINANKCRILFMTMAGIRLNKFFECFLEFVNLSVIGHNLFDDSCILKMINKIMIFMIKIDMISSLYIIFYI